MSLPNHEPLQTDSYTAFKFAQAGFINTAPMSKYKPNTGLEHETSVDHVVDPDTGRLHYRQEQPTEAVPEAATAVRGIESYEDWKKASELLRRPDQISTSLGNLAKRNTAEQPQDTGTTPPPRGSSAVQRHRRKFTDRLRGRGDGGQPR